MYHKTKVSSGNTDFLREIRKIRNEMQCNGNIYEHKYLLVHSLVLTNYYVDYLRMV